MLAILLISLASFFTPDSNAQMLSAGVNGPLVAEIDVNAKPGPWVMVIPDRNAEFFDTICSNAVQADFVDLTSGHRIERKRCEYGASSSKGMNTNCRIYTSSNTILGSIKWVANSHADCGDSLPTIVLDIRSEDAPKLGNATKSYSIARCPGEDVKPNPRIGLRPDLVMNDEQKKMVRAAVDKYIDGVWPGRFKELKSELAVTERTGPPLEDLAKIRTDNKDLLSLNPEVAIKQLKTTWYAQAVFISSMSTTPSFFVKAGWEINGACVSQAHLLIEPTKGGFTTKIVRSEDSISSEQAIQHTCAEWAREVGDVIEVVDTDGDGVGEILLHYNAFTEFGISILEYTPSGLEEVYNYTEGGC